MSENSRFAAFQADIENMNSIADSLLDASAELDKATVSIKVNKLIGAATKVSMSNVQLSIELARKDEEIRELKNALN